MDYHHSKYAGNAADVWKHFCLLAAIKGIFGHKPLLRREPLSFFESHCGSGRFELASDGEWKNGIGNPKPVPVELSQTDYFEHCFQELAKREYLGSWRWAVTTGLFTDFFLCDNNPDVIQRAKKEASHLSNAKFHFSSADGFEMLGRPEKYGFVLIDPPYVTESDWEKVQALATVLPAQQEHFLIWYPIFGGGKKRDFAKLERVEVLWRSSERENEMIGCGVTGSLSATSALSELPEIEQLRRWLKD